MLNQITQLGYWNIPGMDKQVSGEISFDPNKGITLKTLGLLDFESSRAEVIHGFTSTGNKFSLLECDVRASYPSPGIKTGTIKAKYLLIGEHVPSIDELLLDTIAVHYQYLDEWVNISGFEGGTIETDNEDEYKAVIKYKQPRPITLYTSEKKEVLIWFSAVSPAFISDVKENAITQKTYINFNYTPGLPLKDCLKEITHFRNFFAFGLSRVAIPTEIFGYYRENGRRKRIQLIYREVYYPLAKANYIHPSTTLFCFEDIKHKAEEIVVNWFRKYETLQPVFDRYFDCLYNPQMHALNQFLNSVFAIETYHRRTNQAKQFPNETFNQIRETLLGSLEDKKIRDWLKEKTLHLNEISLRQRLKQICIQFNNIVKEFLPKPADFIDSIVINRNYYVHYDSTLLHKAHKENDLPTFTAKLHILLQLCLLHELGFSEDETKRALKRSWYNWDHFKKSKKKV